MCRAIRPPQRPRAGGSGRFTRPLPACPAGPKDCLARTLWLRDGGLEQKFFSSGRQASRAAGVCFQSLGKLALTEDEIKSIKVPVVVLFGDSDPLRKLYAEPLKEVRKDWQVIEIPDADHISCIFKSRFRDEIRNWLAAHPAH
jgi:hypothetical protein